jgi:hypothetical protein
MRYPFQPLQHTLTCFLAHSFNAIASCNTITTITTRIVSLGRAFVARPCTTADLARICSCALVNVDCLLARTFFLGDEVEALIAAVGGGRDLWSGGSWSGGGKQALSAAASAQAACALIDKDGRGSWAIAGIFHEVPTFIATACSKNA